MRAKTRSVVVIGGGLGGLAVALRLRAAGWRVTVCEQGPRLGGKMNCWEREGFRFDTGPSLITMPWVFEYEYPDEPKANGRQSVRLGDGGTTFGDASVVGRTSLDGGALRVVTERRGKDDGQDALFRYTYLIGASSFSIRKEVRPEGAAEFFERNRYSWTR